MSSSGGRFLLGLGFLFLALALSPPSQARARNCDAVLEFPERVQALQTQYEERTVVEPRFRPFLRVHPYPTGRVVVLLHGLFGKPGSHTEVADFLFNLGYNVVAPLWPRTQDGSFSSLEGLSLEGILHDLAQTLDEVRFLGEEVDVFGYSYAGGLVPLLANSGVKFSRGVLVAPVIRVRRPYSLFPKRLASWLVSHLVKGVSRDLANETQETVFATIDALEALPPLEVPLHAILAEGERFFRNDAALDFLGKKGGYGSTISMADCGHTGIKMRPEFVEMLCRLYPNKTIEPDASP